MKKKLTIKQRIKACFILLVSNSTLSYVIDLEERCKKANFAPFSLRVPEEGEYFVWDEETIQNAENYLRQHHPELANIVCQKHYFGVLFCPSKYTSCKQCPNFK